MFVLCAALVNVMGTWICIKPGEGLKANIQKNNEGWAALYAESVSISDTYACCWLAVSCRCACLPVLV
jgi:hypothetical protein